MNPLTDLQAGITHTIHHSILDQISKTIMGTQVTTRTDRMSIEKTMEPEGINRITGLIREIIAFRTDRAKA